MARGEKKTKKGRGDDSEEENAQPAKNTKDLKKQQDPEEDSGSRSQKKGKAGKRGGKRGDSDAEDEPVPPPKGGKKDVDPEDDESSPVAKKGARGKQNKQKKGKGGRDDDNEDEDAPKIDIEKEVDDIPQPVKKGGRGKQKARGKGHEEESDEEPVEAIPQPAKKGAKGKQQGKGKGRVDDDEEEEEEENDVEIPQPAKKGGRGQKKGRAAVQEVDEDDEEEEAVDIPQPAKKGKNKQRGKKAVDDDDEEMEDVEVPRPVKKGGKADKKGGKKAAPVDEEVEEDEPEDIPQPAKKGRAKQQQKAKGRQAADEDAEEEEEAEEVQIAQPVKKGKQRNKGKKAQVVEEEEEEEEIEEEVEIAQPVKKGKRNKADKKGGKKAQVVDEDEEEEEEEEVEEEIPQPVKKGGKSKPTKGKKGQAMEDEEDEEEVETEVKPPAKGSKPTETAKPKGKQEPAPVAVPAPKKSAPAPAAPAPVAEASPSSSKKGKGKEKAAPIPEPEPEPEVDEEEAVIDGVEGLSINAEEEGEAQEGGEGEEEEVQVSSRRKKGAAAKRDKKRDKKAAKQTKQQQAIAKANEPDAAQYHDGEDDDYEAMMNVEDMKGREPPTFVHLRTTAAVRSRIGNDVKAENLTLQVPGRTLLRDAGLTLAYGQRYGLVGRNGIGKSTLVKAVANRENIQVAEHLRMLYVEQEVVGDETTPLDSVLRADPEREWLLKEEQELLRLDKEDPYWMDNPKEKRAYSMKDIYERLRDIESEKAVGRASAILVGLGFTMDEIGSKPTSAYSGGWRMRIALARALFCRPEILLLDEPSNHLDLHAVVWLERYLQRWEKTLFVVSHDDVFLNEVVNNIIHMHDCTLTQYKGNYYHFLKTKDENMRAQVKAKGKQDKERARLKTVVNQNQNKQGASKAKVLKKIEENVIILDKDEKSLVVSFPDPDPVDGTFLVRFQDVSFGYEASKPMFRNLDFGMGMDSRIALVGMNGVGKSTMMKLMAGQLKETAGYIERNRKVRMARFTQHSLEHLDLTVSAVEFLAEKFGAPSVHEVRQHLGRFGISGALATNKIDTLSGGQKSRVVLAEIAWQHPHILLLDEPSNHLDTDAIQALAKGLNEFKGGVVLISHNQTLIEATCNEIWIVRKDGTVEKFEGDFEEYKELIASELNLD